MRCVAVTACLTSALLMSACTSAPPPRSTTPGVTTATAPGDVAAAAQIKRILARSMTQHPLRAVIARVTIGGRNVFTGAFGTSMSGVPATPAMHFRNGAMAYTYMGQLLARLVDQDKLSLDDHLATWFPHLPAADRITVRMLANSTAGYADFVYTDTVSRQTDLDPYRQYTTDELIRYGLAEPMTFPPGTNWGYSHTNFAVLGNVLSKAAGMSLADALRTYVLEPMHLRNTTQSTTPDIPPPVLHTFSSERRTALRVPGSLPFYEDSTYWNPSWTAPTGAVETTDITDMATSMAIIGSGAQVSPAMYREQVGNNLVGLGHQTAACPACRTLSAARGFGFMLFRFHGWVVQSKFFAGAAGIVGYLPSKQLTIAIADTFDQDAFDADGNFQNPNDTLLAEVSKVLVPDEPPS